MQSRKRDQANSKIRKRAASKGKQSARSPKTRAVRYENLTARERAAYDRTTNLVTDLRRGEGSYTKLLRKHHLSSATARKYAGRDLVGGRRGKSVRASKADRRVRHLWFPESSGDVRIRARSSRDATKLSTYFHDRDMLLRGKLRPQDFEAKWWGMEVAGRELFADATRILQMGDEDVLKVEHLYASTGGER